MGPTCPNSGKASLVIKFGLTKSTKMLFVGICKRFCLSLKLAQKFIGRVAVLLFIFDFLYSFTWQFNQIAQSITLSCFDMLTFEWMNHCSCGCHVWNVDMKANLAQVELVLSPSLTTSYGLAQLSCAKKILAVDTSTMFFDLLHSWNYSKMTDGDRKLLKLKSLDCLYNNCWA